MSIQYIQTGKIWKYLKHGGVMKAIPVIAMWLLFACLASCAMSPELDSRAKQDIIRGIPAAEGAVLYSTVAIWLPHSQTYEFVASQPSVPGVVTITEKSLLFQQWGGPNGMTTLQRIAVTDIADLQIIRFGASARMVVRLKDGRFHSFAASDGEGQASIAAGTAEMHDTLLKAIRRKA